MLGLLGGSKSKQGEPCKGRIGGVLLRNFNQVVIESCRYTEQWR